MSGQAFDTVAATLRLNRLTYARAQEAAQEYGVTVPRILGAAVECGLSRALDAIGSAALVAVETAAAEAPAPVAAGRDGRCLTCWEFTCVLPEHGHGAAGEVGG